MTSCATYTISIYGNRILFISFFFHFPPNSTQKPIAKQVLRTTIINTRTCWIWHLRTTIITIIIIFFFFLPPTTLSQNTTFNFPSFTLRNITLLYNNPISPNTASSFSTTFSFSITNPTTPSSTAHNRFSFFLNSSRPTRFSPSISTPTATNSLLGLTTSVKDNPASNSNSTKNRSGKRFAIGFCVAIVGPVLQLVSVLPLLVLFCTVVWVALHHFHFPVATVHTTASLTPPGSCNRSTTSEIATAVSSTRGLHPVPFFLQEIICYCFIFLFLLLPCLVVDFNPN